MSRFNDDPFLITYVLRLFNAKARMLRGEAGQRARFYALLNAIARRRKELAA